MTYRYAVASGFVTGILAGLVVEVLAWWTYTGHSDWSATGLLLVVLGLLAVVIVGRWQLARRPVRRLASATEYAAVGMP